ncbi:MAG: RHS repeat domain-containing protein, partial [Phycisphaerae bacterium]
MNRTTTYTYDTSDQLIRTTLPSPDGSTAATAFPEIRTTYDKAGNVRTRTDALNRVTTWEYDALNR